MRPLVMVWIVLWLSCGTNEAVVLGPPDPAQCEVSVEPSDGLVADGLTTATVTVTVRDAARNPLPGFTVTLSAADVKASVLQPSDVTDVAGLATGRIGNTRAGLTTVTATVRFGGGAGDRIEVGQARVTFEPGPIDTIIVVAPEAAVAGESTEPPIRAELYDARGNRVVAASQPVALTLRHGEGGLSGNTSVLPVEGVATFQGVSITLAGGQELKVQSGTVVSYSATSVAVAPGPLSGLSPPAAPSLASVGRPLVPVPTVNLVDAFGNARADDSVAVTLSLVGSEGPIAESVHAITAAGAAVFPEVVPFTPTAAARLVATADGLLPGESVSFEVTPEREVRGFLTYERPAAGESGLEYDTVTSHPIRGAVVEALDAKGGVLDETTSAMDGSYSLVFGGDATIRVRAWARTVSPPIRIEDNTNDDVIWSVTSPAVDVVATPTVDLVARLGWTGSHYGKARESAPFAILDSLYEASRRTLDVVEVTLPPLSANWSPLNAPWYGDVALGEIGGAHFSPADRELYFSGFEDEDTDEFDSHVVVHEWGHYLQSTLGREDGLGGQHGLGDVLDPRVAFSEGLGTALSALLLSPDSVYVDTYGSNQGSSFVMNLEAGDDPLQDPTPGWFSEHSVQSLVFDLFDAPSADEPYDQVTLDLALLFDVLDGPVRGTDALATVFSFLSGLRALHPDDATAITSLVEWYDIDPVSDDFGASETHDGGWAPNLPVYRDGVVNGAATVLKFKSEDGHNRLAANRYVRFIAQDPMTGISILNCNKFMYAQGFHRGKEIYADWADKGFNMMTTPNETYIVVIMDLCALNVANGLCKPAQTTTCKVELTTWGQ